MILRLGLAFLPALLLFAACDPDSIKGTGDLITETRNVKDFKAVNFSGDGELVVTRDTGFAVQVQVEESLLPYLETEVRNGVLEIYFSRNVRNVDDLLIKVKLPKLESLESSGSAVVRTVGTFSGDAIQIKSSGSSVLDLGDFAYEKKISLDLSGSTELDLRGSTELLEFKLSGSTVADALNCPGKKVHVDMSGSGNLKVFAEEMLDVHLSGSGEVRYLGSPTVKTDISGSGSVRAL